MARGESFYDVLTLAVADLAEHGYDSEERLAYWQRRILEAADGALKSPAEMERTLRAALEEVYRRLVEKEGILKRHPGVARFTLAQVTPALRRELDRRIMASAELIRLNRAKAIEQTLQRFSGWATSIPPGGSGVVDRVETKANIRKALAQLPFEERRVAIDQGHKFAANLNEILATQGNAIAGVWSSHWRQAGYDYREDHKERDGRVYAVRGNWALQAGLTKSGPAGYVDDITRPGEEIFCRCSYVYLYNLRDLPPEMLTVKGRAELQKLRIA